MTDLVRAKSLYDYRQELLEIDLAVDETGELTEEQAAKIVKLHTGSIKKMQSLVWAINKIGDCVDAVDAEIERLKDLKKYRKGIQARIENALMLHVIETEPEKRKIDIETYIVSAKKCPVSVSVNDDFNNPEYMKTKTETTPDKEKIKEVLKGGGKVDGAMLVENRYRLEIK